MTSKNAQGIFSRRLMLGSDAQSLTEEKNRAKTELIRVYINSVSTNYAHMRASKALQSPEQGIST